MPIVLELLVVVAANVLGAAMSLPQVVRLLRTRQVSGVSPAWAALSVVTNLWWLAYGVGVGSWAIVPVAAVSVLGYTAILAALAAFGGLVSGRTGVLVPVLAVAGLPALGLVLGGWAAAGVVLGALYAVQLAPAVLGAYRAADLRGVSGGTWGIAWLEAALWGVYGIAAGDAGLLALAVAGLAMSSLVLARLVAVVADRHRDLRQMSALHP